MLRDGRFPSPSRVHQAQCTSSGRKITESRLWSRAHFAVYCFRMNVVFATTELLDAKMYLLSQGLKKKVSSRTSPSFFWVSFLCKAANDTVATESHELLSGVFLPLIQINPMPQGSEAFFRSSCIFYLLWLRFALEPAVCLTVGKLCYFILYQPSMTEKGLGLSVCEHLILFLRSFVSFGKTACHPCLKLVFHAS